MRRLPLRQKHNARGALSPLQMCSGSLRHSCLVLQLLNIDWIEERRGTVCLERVCLCTCLSNSQETTQLTKGSLFNRLHSLQQLRAAGLLVKQHQTTNSVHHNTVFNLVLGSEENARSLLKLFHDSSETILPILPHFKILYQ